MSLFCRGNTIGSASRIAHSRGFTMSSIFVPIFGRKIDSRECCSAANVSRCNGGSSSINRTTDGACIACSTFWGRVVIPWALVQQPSCSSVLVRSRNKFFLRLRFAGVLVGSRRPSKSTMGEVVTSRPIGVISASLTLCS